MKTVVVSLSFARRAGEVVLDTPLRFQLSPTSTNTWAFDDEVEDIEESIKDIFQEGGIPSGEFEFTDC